MAANPVKNQANEVNNQKQGKGKSWHGPVHDGPAKGKVKRGGKPKYGKGGKK